MCSENDWERICEDSAEFENRCTSRMRIEGGSLYRYELNTPISANSRAVCISMVFVPDPAPPIRGCKVNRRKTRKSNKNE